MTRVKPQFILNQGAPVGIGIFILAWISWQQANGAKVIRSAMSFPLYEKAVSTVPSCTRVVARGEISVCLGSICYGLFGKMDEMASFSFNENLILIGHQFTIPS